MRVKEEVNSKMLFTICDMRPNESKNGILVNNAFVEYELHIAITFLS